LRYFAEGSTRESEEETIPEPNTDDAIIFKEFFRMGLRMPPHPALTKISLKFWVQLNQLTLNAIAQLSKFFWDVLSFGRETRSDGFTNVIEPPQK
jgi:hypothetical protein